MVASGSPTPPKPIPVVPGKPLVGNALDMGGDLRLYLTRQYRQYGPVFQLTAFGKPIVVLAGVDANKFLAREGGNALRMFEIWSKVDPMFGVERSILSMDGEEHRRIRKVQRRAFGRGYLEENLHVAYRVVSEDLQKLRPAQEIEVTRWCQALVMEQLSRLAVQSTSRPFLDDMTAFLRTALMVGLIGAWPRAALYLPKYQRARKAVFALADHLIEHHRHNPPGKHRRPDLIDDLLDAQREDPAGWTHDDVRAGALTAFSAGLDTAASMLAFTLYRLHRHPGVLERVRAELKELFQHGEPTLEALGRAPTLHGAVLETLRLHPVAPALSRFAPQDFEFAGYRIPAGSQVIVGTTVAHGLSEVYPDPDEFIPERFGPERAEHRRAGVFNPFGAGAHTCLGSGLAEGLLLVNVASLLNRVDFSLDPNYTLQVSQQPAPAPTKSFRLRVEKVRPEGLSGRRLR